MYILMNEWRKNVGMNECMYILMGEWMYVYMNECLYEWMYVYIYVWMNDVYMNERMYMLNEWMYIWMNEWMYVWMNVYIFSRKILDEFKMVVLLCCSCFEVLVVIELKGWISYIRCVGGSFWWGIRGRRLGSVFWLGFYFRVRRFRSVSIFGCKI